MAPYKKYINNQGDKIQKDCQIKMKYIAYYFDIISRKAKLVRNSRTKNYITSIPV